MNTKKMVIIYHFSFSLILIVYLDFSFYDFSKKVQVSYQSDWSEGT